MAHRIRLQVSPRFAGQAKATAYGRGRLLVKVAMTIDGQPFRSTREKLLDEILTAVDKDKDGKVMWKEALTTGSETPFRDRLT